MKRLYIDDYIHTQLKKEAEAEGRTLQWWVENKLTGGYEADNKIIEEAVKSGLMVEARKTYDAFIPPIDKHPESPLNPKQEIQRQIKALETEISEVDPETQETDTIMEMSKKAQKIKDLWAEWHKL